MIHANPRGAVCAACALATAVWCGAAPALAQEPPPPGGDTTWGWPGAPQGFVPPYLNPTGVQLETRELAPGVYALLSNAGGIDNSGFIVGDRGVLVIDAHINGTMAQQIIDAVAAVTDQPILYLVNTNYHGDHTFGNYKFPASTTIIAHRHTAERMRDFDHEKVLMFATTRGATQVYADVKLRLPDVVFEQFMRIDLGGRAVELHHFGEGNTPGDVVVYEPESKTAWTGNLVVGGPIPPMFEAGAATYLQTLAKMRATLDVETIVPGHVGMADGGTVNGNIAYCSDLTRTVQEALRAGKSVDQVLAEQPLAPPYLPPAGAIPDRQLAFLQGLHRLNLVRTYEELAGR